MTLHWGELVQNEVYRIHAPTREQTEQKELPLVMPCAAHPKAHLQQQA